MKEKLLLVGAGGFGRIAMEHAVREYDCAFVDDSYPSTKEVCSIPVVGKISDLATLFNTYKKLIVVIGNTKLRESIYQQATKIGYDFPNIIATSAYISPFATIGKGCVILNNVVIQNQAQIGNGVLLNPGVEVHHNCSIGSCSNRENDFEDDNSERNIDKIFIESKVLKSSHTEFCSKEESEEDSSSPK